MLVDPLSRRWVRDARDALSDPTQRFDLSGRQCDVARLTERGVAYKDAVTVLIDIGRAVAQTPLGEIPATLKPVLFDLFPPRF